MKDSDTRQLRASPTWAAVQMSSHMHVLLALQCTPPVAVIHEAYR